MRRHLGLALLTVAGALVFAAADAQAPAGSPAAAPAAAAAPEVSEVVVTGSRVITNGNDSPTPLTVVSTEQMLEVQPTTVIDAVNLMPALQGSQTLSTAAGGGQRNGAAAYIDLRDMGDLRTLILFDGHRVVPTINQNEANVDTWVIPQLLIQRVDLVTGGVSAVYGSDAVSGVVNFITDTKFNGVKVQANAGTSQYGDDHQSDIGAAAGTNLFDGRGHIEAAYEFHYDPGIFNRLSRPFFAQDLGTSGTGTAASPYGIATHVVTSTSSFGGRINSGPLANLEFAQNGVLSQFVNGSSIGVTGQQSGGDGIWQEATSLKSALVFHQGFSRFDYDITDSVHGYLQLAVTSQHTFDDYQSPQVSNTPIGYSNPYLGSIQQPYLGQLQAQAALTPNGSFQFSRLFLNTPLAEQRTNTYMVMGGLNGTIGTYKWDVGFERAQSVILEQNDYNVNNGNLLAALNAVNSPATGQITCAAAATNSAYANCVPLNPFGPTAQSPAAMAYIYGATYNENRTVLDEANVSLTGAPVSTWAGPVNMALSAEWRLIAWDISANASPSTLASCTGIQFGCTQGVTKLWMFNTQPSNPYVSETVGEAAYETDVPLLKDAPFAKALDFNGAVRYTRYNISGSATTWKVGLEWHIDDQFTIRGTRSRDIRAPNLWELYSPETVAPLTNYNDVYTRTTGNTSQTVESNPKLQPEVAATYTAGIIYQPNWLPRFSVSLDAFHIVLDNAIFQLSGQNLTNQCNTAQGTLSYCSLIVRPHPWSDTTSDNFITQFLSQYQNIASFKTYGLDLEVNYSVPVFDRNLTMRGLMSYQPHFVANLGPGGVTDMGDAANGLGALAGAAGQALPSLKYTLIGSYQVTHDFSVSILEHGRNSMKAAVVANIAAPLVFTHPYDPSIAYTNLTLSYKFTASVGEFAGETEAYLNIQNLFNTFPTYYYSGSVIPGDDPVGRYYMIGFRFKH